MPRKGENIYKRKDGRWEGRYIKGHSPTGKAIYGYVYAYSYKEVKAKLNLVVSGKSTAPGSRTPGTTFAELSEQWLRSQKTRVKESTYNKYDNILYSYILPYIGNTHVRDLSHDCISGLCDTLLSCGGKRGDGLSAKTVGDTISVIRSVIQYSVNMGYTYSFDVRSIRVRQQARELRVLSRNEQSVLYSYLCIDHSVYSTGILICLLTGLRIGEVCALCWEDISFSDHTIYVHKTAQRIQNKGESGNKTKIVITSPKSVSGKRVIPMPESLEVILLSMRSARTGFVLSMDGAELTEPRVLQYHFKKILKKLDIEQVNFHVLRHTFATRCIEVGFDVKSLSEILGHSSVSITMNKYVHPSMDLKRENMQRLSSLFAVK